MSDAEQVPALLVALSHLIETWTLTLSLHGHRPAVRQHLEANMREMAANLRTAATEPDPAKLQPEQEAHA